MRVRRTNNTLFIRREKREPVRILDDLPDQLRDRGFSCSLRGTGKTLWGYAYIKLAFRTDRHADDAQQLINDARSKY
jgi:hypothetical protein